MSPLTKTIGWLDWVVLGVYLLANLWLGGFFARRQTSTERYFVAGRSVPAWAVGVSLFATSISTATFIAYPGHGFRGDWTHLLSGYVVPFVAVFIACIVIPFYRRAVKMSAYEYFEHRFGYGARAYAALLFILFNVFRMGFILYLMAKATYTVTGWDLRGTIIICGIVTTAYTVAGGIDAVIWTDVLQAFVMIGGCLLCLFVLLFASEGGPAQAVRVAYEAGKFKLADFSLDLTQPTILVLLLYGFFLHAQVYSGNQDYVQRYLSVPTTRQAQKSMWIGSLSCVVTWTLFMFIGTLLYSYYTQSPGLLPDAVRKKETEVFPYFVMTHMPPGVVGLILAAVCAAAMTNINGIAMVTLCDVYVRFRPDTGEGAQLRLAKLFSCFWGVVGTAVGLLMLQVEKALEFSFKVLSLLGGGMFGMLLLAFFVRRAHALGVYIGLACGVLVTAWGTLPELARLGMPLPQVCRDYPFPYHTYLGGTFANAAAFLVGYAASLLLPDVTRRDPAGLTVWDMPRATAQDAQDSGASGPAPLR